MSLSKDFIRQCEVYAPRWGADQSLSTLVVGCGLW